MRVPDRWITGFLLLTVALGAAAQGPAAADFRPTGPVTVTADRAEWSEGGPMRYSGNVGLSSDSLKLRGDSLELLQRAQGEFDARVGGKPAQLDHAGQPGGAGSAAKPVTAQAGELQYDSTTGIVQLVGNARLMRGGDEITGDRIRYDVRARRIQADGGGGGQVKIVIQAPPKAGAGTTP